MTYNPMQTSEMEDPAEVEAEGPVIAPQVMRNSYLEQEAETRGNVGRFSRAMLIAVIVLLIFSSARLLDVVNGFSVGPVQDTAVALATTWDAQMDKTGMKRLAETVHAQVETARALSWDGAEGVLGSVTRQQNMERGALILRGMLEEAATIEARAGEAKAHKWASSRQH